MCFRGHVVDESRHLAPLQFVQKRAFWPCRLHEQATHRSISFVLGSDRCTARRVLALRSSSCRPAEQVMNAMRGTTRFGRLPGRTPSGPPFVVFVVFVEEVETHAPWTQISFRGLWVALISQTTASACVLASENGLKAWFGPRGVQQYG